MSEAAPAGGILRRIDRMIDSTRGVPAVLLASLAFGAAGATIENPFETSVANADTPAHLSHSPATVQEYIKVIADDSSGNALPKVPKNTFVFSEQCVDGSRKITRTVHYNQANQPLGSCAIGSVVTVTEKQPLQGSWVDQSGRKEKISKATQKNNHRFVFTEQMQGKEVSISPSNPVSSAPEQPVPAPPEQPVPTPPVQPNPGNPYAPGNVGVDVSWAQCDTTNETPSGADFGIVDVNDGLGYSTNPCLEPEAVNFPGKALDLYVNTGWNDQSSHIDPNSPRVCISGDENCLAYNYGYNAGLYAYDAAASEGVTSATWWLDVESNATWSNDTAQNQNSLQGEHDALIANGAETVGAYSTTVQWDDITGSWQNEWPSWGATTWTTAADARTYCIGHEFTGGPSELMQFTPTSQLDEDLAC